MLNKSLSDRLQAVYDSIDQVELNLILAQAKLDYSRIVTKVTAAEKLSHFNYCHELPYDEVAFKSLCDKVEGYPSTILPPTDGFEFFLDWVALQRKT